jgi:hypothetical protein
VDGGDLREDWGLIGCDASAEVCCCCCCCCITVTTINHPEELFWFPVYLFCFASQKKWCVLFEYFYGYLNKFE